MKEIFDRFLQECPVVAILRGITTQEIIPVCDALYHAGIRLLEIPLNTPDACKSISLAAKHCEGKQLVGAGTVLIPAEVCAVEKAGGCFIISPNTDIEVIHETKKRDLLSIPGFFTATEGFTAVKAGADYLKLFPACLGPGYVKDLKAVIKHPIMAVGRVTAENITSFLQVCCGAGVGSALYKPGKNIEQIAADAAKIAGEAKKVQK